VRAIRDGICTNCLAHVVERGGNGREALKKSEKVERAADGRSEASSRSVPRLLQALQSVPLQANTQQVQTTQSPTLSVAPESSTVKKSKSSIVEARAGAEGHLPCAGFL
jgi:hypothetical protein